MENTYYFSHDYNVRSDEKIKRLFRKWGLEGYGLYWALIEDLYNNANALHLDYEGLAFDFRTQEELVKSVIEDFDLFVINEEIFYSKSVWKRLDARADKSAKARESANARWNKKNANAKQTQNDSNAIKERKGKEKKVKEIESKKKYGEYSHVLLTDKEINKLEEEYNKELISSYIKKLDEYIEVKGAKYKNHNLVIRNWLGKDASSKKSFEKVGKTDPLEGL